jgi:hypothetical protein
MNTGEGKGIEILTFRMLKLVLLLPRAWFGEMGPPLARGLEGRPIGTKALRGGTGAAAAFSSGVGG